MTASPARPARCGPGSGSRHLCCPTTTDPRSHRMNLFPTHHTLDSHGIFRQPLSSPPLGKCDADRISLLLVPVFVCVFAISFTACCVQGERNNIEAGTHLQHTTIDGVSLGQVRQLPSFRAKVVAVYVGEIPPGARGIDGKLHYSITLKREDGSLIGIGGFDPKQNEVEGMQRLEVGRHYLFPDIFEK